MTLARRGGVSFVSQGDGSVIGAVQHDDAYKNAYLRQIFASSQVRATTLFGFGDPVGTTGASNFANFGGTGGTAAYFIIGAGTTTLAPFNNAGGGFLDAGLQQAAALGVEYLPGGMNSIHNAHKLTVGAGDPAAFIRLKFKNSTVANAAAMSVGFRSMEAFDALIDNYTDVACLNQAAGTIETKTQLASAGAVDTAVAGVQTPADDVEITFEVRVSSLGKVQNFVDGLPVGDASFQFGDALTVLPMVHFLQGAGGSSMDWFELAVGRTWHERNDPTRDRG